MTIKLELMIISFSFFYLQFDYTIVYKRRIITIWYLICKYQWLHLSKSWNHPWDYNQRKPLNAIIRTFFFLGIKHKMNNDGRLKWSRQSYDLCRIVDTQSKQISFFAAKNSSSRRKSNKSDLLLFSYEPHFQLITRGEFNFLIFGGESAINSIIITTPRKKYISIPFVVLFALESSSSLVSTWS